jgi:hypothetical protein
MNDFESLEELEDAVLEQASAMALLRSSVGEDERALAAVEQGEGGDCCEAGGGFPHPAACAAFRCHEEEVDQIDDDDADFDEGGDVGDNYGCSIWHWGMAGSTLVRRAGDEDEQEEQEEEDDRIDDDDEHDSDIDGVNDDEDCDVGHDCDSNEEREEQEEQED